ncbi:protein SLX4IP [Centroberyx affinis]|uniref:protein SLX4IP n=1 Tax=Centroberyx affinis TaxID=166261 RepID=UPI003A5C665E
MTPRKFVIKCGNFAVLVDLHVLPLGGQEEASWFTTDHIEEVTALVRDAVDQRVKQYTESLHNRRQPKQKKELAPAAALCVKGKSFNLVASFLKRHYNLRCVVKQLYGELRVFPERYVVCVSCPEDASAHHGNLSLAATELSEQSRSEYFSRVGETQEPLNGPTKTKKTVLQKMARQASVQRELCGSSVGVQQPDQRASAKDQREELRPGESETSPRETVCSPGEKVPLPEAEQQLNLLPCPAALVEMAQVESTGEQKQGLTRERLTENRLPDSINPNGDSAVSSQHKINQETGKSKRCKPSDVREDPRPQRAKRTCLGAPPASSARELTMRTHPVERSSQTSKYDLLPPPPLPPVEAKAEAESKAFPVSECNKTTLEVELLTPGKRAQRLPLTSNNTAQTNQNRLAASLRGLSVKPASSGSSISSRSTLAEEGSEYVPRTSRLRRLKRS